jgi:multidrug efflux pump subunit AcrA (membrane-fusion protein)
MNKQRFMLVAAVVVIALATVLLLRREPPPPSPPTVTAEPPREIAPAPTSPFATLPPLPEAVTESPTPPELEEITVEEGQAPLKVVRVRADQILATVNHIPVMLKDLMPLRAGETEKSMTPEEYSARLNRAIEMNLTFQAARAQNISLTEAQQRQLQQMQNARQAELQEQQQQGMKYTSFSAEDLEFETQLTMAMMLLQNLLAKEGGPSPLEHEEYGEALQKLLDQLKADANIATSQPPF